MNQYIKINEYGDKFYYSDAAMKILHRIDGPAVEDADGSKAWYVHGKLHRIDGPAIEYADGAKSWYIDDNCLTEEDFNRRTAKEIVLTLD
jgi:hypothetical protein